jgi:hypothetical protein
VRSRLPLILGLAITIAIAAMACASAPEDGSSLSKGRAATLRRGERVPNVTERAAAGPGEGAISRGTSRFSQLVRCDDALIVFKDEEGTGSDRVMTARLRDRLRRLAKLVRKRWPELQLRVTEAWDEEREHGETSLHYEGRAADITTSDMDPVKLGDLASLAATADFDWVYFENDAHVHVSVAK